MKNYIKLLSGEIKEITIISENATVAVCEYYELTGAKRCIRLKSEIVSSKTKAKLL